MHKIYFILLAVMVTSCGQTDGKRHDADSNVMTWANAYFNYDYKTAKKYCSAGSAKWLDFAASNITQQDLDVITNAGEDVQIDIVDHIILNDTAAVVVLSVDNYIQLGNYKQGTKKSNQGKYAIPVVKQDGKWYVKMEGLPRSEKQSHDSNEDI